MENLCITCGKSDRKLTPIFSKRIKRKNTIIEDLNFILLGHKISQVIGDCLNMCVECQKTLHITVNFIRQCIEVQNQLREILKTKEKKNKVVLESKPKIIPFKRVKRNTIPRNEENLSSSHTETLEEDHRHSSDDESPQKEEKTVVVQVIKIEDPSSTEKVNKIFECSFCQRTFNNKFRLKNHLNIHTGDKPYVCQTCNRAFAQPNALKVHKRLHTGEKPYKCPIESCGKSFVQNTTLKTHMAALHTGKNVKCEDCGKCFTRASYLIAHKRLEHLGERPYACHICPNRYKQKSHLDHHIEVHNGIKYTCPICNKSYSKKWSLQVHSYTHMKDDDKITKLPHPCDQCDESFARKDKLRTHVRLRHENFKRKLNEEELGDVPAPSNVVEVETRPICVQTSEGLNGRELRIINIVSSNGFIQEVVVPEGEIYYENPT